MDSYGAGPPVEAPPEKPESESPETESVDEENAGSSEILIGKDQIPGKKVGDTCTFKISKDVGDEFILTSVKETEPAEGTTNDEMSATTESEISAMDAEGA